MVTTLDVARRAGVARPTVSLVLSNKRGSVRIPDETRARVLQAAEELGYRRNEIARAMISSRNRMLGFLVARPEAEATARMLAGALDEADKLGYSLKVLRLKSHQVDQPTIERCVELRLAGVMAIYLDEASLDALHMELTRHAMPIAILEDAVPPWGIGVISDDAQAMSLAIAHLQGLGHKSIGLITLNQGTGPARETAFRGAMEAAELAPNLIARCGIDGSDVEASARGLLTRTPTPTAIIGATDPIAMAIMRVARQQQIKVPKDLSVIGYGDLEMAEHADPRLSSIALPFFEIGAQAVRLLIAQVEAAGPSAAAPEDISPIVSHRPTPLLLPAFLNLRDSTAPKKDTSP